VWQVRLLDISVVIFTLDRYESSASRHKD
jgi:hypothetical protein